MSTPAGEGEARVLLYTRTGCHLCEGAREVVVQVASEAGADWAEVDIDAGPEAPALQARYGEFVPVVLVDGVQQGQWRVDADRLRRALARGSA